MTDATATDWDKYYDHPVPTARLSRRVTGRRLVRCFERFAPNSGRNLRWAELGGANSCFYDLLQTTFAPREYHVVDNNARGLELFRRRVGGTPTVGVHNQDVLSMDVRLDADVVFSVGLIEHFSEQGTRQAVASHFSLVRPGGLVLITFPTPTWLYRACRTMAEVLNVWRFPDERPLRYPEVAAAIAGHGDVLHHEIVWPIVLTQMFIVARKHGCERT